MILVAIARSIFEDAFKIYVTYTHVCCLRLHVPHISHNTSLVWMHNVGNKLELAITAAGLLSHSHITPHLFWSEG